MEKIKNNEETLAFDNVSEKELAVIAEGILALARKMNNSEVEGVVDTLVKKVGDSGHVIVPKKFVGRQASVTIFKETKSGGKKEVK